MNRYPATRAEAALLRALTPHAAPFVLLAASSRDWASALFVGARHRLTLALQGPDAAPRAQALARTLAEIDLPLPGAFVADIVVTLLADSGRPVLMIEALTIEEAEALPLRRGAGGRAG